MSYLFNLQSTCNAGDPGSIPGSGKSAGEGIGYPVQYSWASLVAQLVKNLPVMWDTLVWSLGWEDPWRRERLPTPVIWPGEFHGLYSPWGHKESDKTEQLSLHIRKWWLPPSLPTCLPYSESLPGMFRCSDIDRASSLFPSAWLNHPLLCDKVKNGLLKS